MLYNTKAIHGYVVMKHHNMLIHKTTLHLHDYKNYVLYNKTEVETEIALLAACSKLELTKRFKNEMDDRSKEQLNL